MDSLEGGLIVSNRTQFDWELENVTAVIFVELNITPEYFENILDKVRKGRQNDLPVSVYFLCSRNPADINTLKRLMFRAVDARVVMDGIEEPNMAAPDF